MHLAIKAFILITLCVLTGFKISAQQKDSLLTGMIKGKVKDSVYNFMLTSATVAVYKDADSSLLQFTIANNFGEFAIQPLPVEIPLRLIVTHVGYGPFFRKFTLDKEKKEVDMGLLYMHQNTDKDGNTLEEVVVRSIPPMRMNGDTVEFNADAFRMEANATAEDLMRRLPGFTVWGDGEITYNGKKINAVLVEGKPFMGGSTAVATQNLPKEVLDKIQVYQQGDEKNPLDSTMFANIKLKDDKKMGYFGKLSFGYGITPSSSDEAEEKPQYAADGMLSGFNKKIQVNTVGAVNNINKLAGSTDVLMKNSSFKGEDATMEYQSDFRMRGLNSPAAAGIKFQYDFIPEVQYQKSNRLNADYFLSGNHILVKENTLINNFLGADTILSQRAISTGNSRSFDQKLNTRYERSSEKLYLAITASLNNAHYKNVNETTAEQEKTGVGIISNSFSHNESETNNKGMDMGVDYTNRENYRDNKKRISKEFSVGYRFSTYDNNGYSRNWSQYNSSVDMSDNRLFDRVYEQRDGKGTTHNMNMSYPGLTKLIFNRNPLGGVRLGVSGTFIFKNDTYADKVLDRDTITQTYVQNNYLTNTRTVTTRDLRPAFTVSKTFYKGLTNRYNKWVTLSANFRNQYYNMEHSSTHAFQQFSYYYTKFIPDASAEYSNNQYGSYDVKYSLSFTTEVNYPEVYHIAPLVDSTNLWYIPKGNKHIRPQYQKRLFVAYDFTTRTPKNPLNFNIKIGLGQTDDSFTDSTLYNNAGVRTVYIVNRSGNKYINGEYGIRKSFELKKNITLEANGRYNINIGQSPQYINSVLNSSRNTWQHVVLYFGFRYKEVLNIKAEQGLSFYSSRQQGFDNNRFENANSYSRFIGTLQLPKNLVWSSNITYNKSSSNSTVPVHFTIWNTSLTYRFLKGNTGEAKFSALDLLRQNKGIVNTTSGNVQTFTSSNVLQQYFMLTLSYYPRKFGNKK